MVIPIPLQPNYDLHLICAHLNRKAYNQKVMQSVYHEKVRNKDIVIFKGTSNLKELSYSLQLWENNSNVHEGYFQYSQNCKHKVLNLEIENRPNLVFTGHSLGSIAAALVANELNIKAEVVLFGSPKLATREFRDQIEQNVNLTIFNYVNKNDVIAEYPFVYYYHMSEPIYLENGNIKYMNPISYHSMQQYAFNILRRKKQT
jgi:predicted lipase